MSISNLFKIIDLLHKILISTFHFYPLGVCNWNFAEQITHVHKSPMNQNQEEICASLWSATSITCLNIDINPRYWVLSNDFRDICRYLSTFREVRFFWVKWLSYGVIFHAEQLFQVKVLLNADRWKVIKLLSFWKTDRNNTHPQRIGIERRYQLVTCSKLSVYYIKFRCQLFISIF
jgi:hypothetical protein